MLKFQPYFLATPQSTPRVLCGPSSVLYRQPRWNTGVISGVGKVSLVLPNSMNVHQSGAKHVQEEMSIQPLPESVIAQIKSSITITDLNGVICELFKNSLDAGAAKINVTFDYCRGGCVVEDDGIGILPEEFGSNGGIGKLYREISLPFCVVAHMR